MDYRYVPEIVFLTSPLFHVVLRLVTKQSKGGKYFNRNTKHPMRTICQRSVSSMRGRTLFRLHHSAPGLAPGITQ